MLEGLFQNQSTIKKIQKDLKELEPAIDILIIALFDYKNQCLQSFIDRLNDEQHEQLLEAIADIYVRMTDDKI